ncbi:MAG: DUF2357 domain-containing protein [Bacilli bacterium]|nr:DUF2357 domain-containing protein [Bacilli bacterium]MDD4795243.1 DUF2357 domain-containing protein [Bacilli bacterium]
MSEELQSIVNNLNADETKDFITKTKSKVIAKKNSEKLTIDFSWVDIIIDAIPYLDNIIRNPRRFIVQEEDIIPIEKTKKVTEESIKHLAQHTSLIQEVDKDGVVKPIKLLNIFKEETIDLYENRFVYSLINNLYVFVQNQLAYKDEESSFKEIKTVNYEAKTKFKNEDINYAISLKSVNYEKLASGPSKPLNLQEKIEEIRDILDDFKSSQFMKNMISATPVRSPIRKTNVILKDQNFIYALRLWEFLERFQIEKPIRKYKETKDFSNNIIDKKYSLTYYLNYCILNNLDDDDIVVDNSKYAGLKKLIYDTAKNFDVNEMELKTVINNELKQASKYKQDQIKGINATYKKFYNKHLASVQKVITMLR